jgi:nucleotide-binding universal stress UspA family protein
MHRNEGSVFMESGATPPGILVPLDGSSLAEQVLPYAQALLAPGAALTLLEVVEDVEPVYGVRGRLLVPVEDARRLFEHRAQDDLKRAEEKLHGERTAVHVEVVGGDPTEQILRVAAAREVELIAMTTHGRGALERWVFGSVADRVARNSPVPVLLVRPSEREPRPVTIRRLVVPLDGSALAEEALPTAQALATRLRVPIHLISVIDVMRIIPAELGPVVAFDAAVYEDTLSQLDTGAAALLADVSQRLEHDSLHTSSEVAHGSPFSMITDAVQDGDLIVMTSHGRGGVRRWLLGSVAEKLVREAPVPVVLVPVAARGSRMATEMLVAH